MLHGPVPRQSAAQYKVAVYTQFDSPQFAHAFLARGFHAPQERHCFCGLVNNRRHRSTT